jgi:pleckstrin homology domain-containing family G member 4
LFSFNNSSCVAALHQKHIAKGKDLTEAATELDSLKHAGENLNSLLKSYSIRLESLREKIEGAARLHHLLALKLDEEDIQKEMQKLAEKIGLSSLMQTIKSCNSINQLKKVTGKMTITTTMITTSTPKKENISDSSSNNNSTNFILPSIEESPERRIDSNNTMKVVNNNDNSDKTDDLSSKTLDDSGLDTYVETSFDESSIYQQEDTKPSRSCSCQSIVDDVTLAHDDDNADLDDYDTSENINSISVDQSADKSESICDMVPVSTVPTLQANAHLYCHASNLQLDMDDTIIDQKTQK